MAHPYHHRKALCHNRKVQYRILLVRMLIRHSSHSMAIPIADRPHQSLDLGAFILGTCEGLLVGGC